MNPIMIYFNGLFLIGKLDDRKLLNPRIYALLQVAQGQMQHAMNHLPGKPAFISLPKDILYWPVQDKEIEALYVKATTNLVLVQ
mgnify:CR=1 FL=1